MAGAETEPEEPLERDGGSVASASSSAAAKTETNPEKCLLGELLCISDGACIRFVQLCDGTRDCSDGADESDCDYE